MAWRSRYFEAHSFRRLFKDYFARGARWTAAPRPKLRDELYDYNWSPPQKGEPLRYMITEFEPVFDAADFVRCGRDLFGIRSNVINAACFEWLRRHLTRDGYRVHEVPQQCRTAMHIDSSFVPLAPGKVLVNPDYVNPTALPPVLKTWDILIAPRPDPAPLSAWLSRLPVQSLDQYQRAHAGSETRCRGSEPKDADRGVPELGLRSDTLSISQSRAIWGVVPLRNSRHQAPWRAQVLLLKRSPP
jgi:hypothetical protein